MISQAGFNVALHFEEGRRSNGVGAVCAAVNDEDRADTPDGGFDQAPMAVMQRLSVTDHRGCGL